MGRVSDAMVELFLNEFFAGMARHPDADGILLALHGAMVTSSDDDGEGLVLQRVREKVGPDLPIVVTLDLHAHVTARMVEHATAIIIYKTYPHIDPRERAVEAVRMMADVLEGRCHPTMALCKPPLIPLVNMQFTDRGAARHFMEHLTQLERGGGARDGAHARVLSASLAMGFPWADIAHLGMAFVVCTDDDLPAAQRLADQLGAQAWARREESAAGLPFGPSFGRPDKCFSFSAHMNSSNLKDAPDFDDKAFRQDFDDKAAPEPMFI